MKEKTYTFHEDPGHGWLAVPVSELRKLGITDKISQYSYQKGGTAYLEEDCDAGVFIDALKARGFSVKFQEKVYPRNPAPIRYYPRFVG